VRKNCVTVTIRLSRSNQQDRDKDIPTISIFYGIFIKMFFADHAPAHFHAEYGEYKR
jgi:hypothetical protein